MSTQAVTVGMGLGLLSSFLQNYDEVIACFQSCNSWVLKTEKVLSYLTFMLGASKPGQLVHILIKGVLNDICLKYLGTTFEENPKVVNSIETILFYIGQRNLEGIWDSVRDSGVCMTFNNCENDFFIGLTNMKISWCEVERNDEDWYTGQPLTNCEQIFNDAPLIILAFIMAIMFIIAYANMPDISDRPPPGSNMKPFFSNKPNSPTSQKNTSSSPKNSQNTGQKDSTQDPLRSKGQMSQHPRSGEGLGTGSHRDLSSNTGSNTQPSSSVAASGPGPSNIQTVNAFCPTCKKRYTYKLSRPTPIYCCNSCSEGKYPPPNPPRCNQNDSYSNSNSTITQEGGIKSANIEELLEDIRKHLCSKCKKNLDKRAGLKAPITIENGCQFCGVPHSS